MARFAGVLDGRLAILARSELKACHRFSGPGIGAILDACAAADVSQSRGKLTRHT
jgi:hypothetical protein